MKIKFEAIIECKECYRETKVPAECKLLYNQLFKIDIQYWDQHWDLKGNDFFCERCKK